MDISSVAGYVLGLALIVWSMGHNGIAGLKLFIHGPAAAVVFGGSLAAVLVHFPLSDVKNFFKVLGKIFLYKEPPHHEHIETIMQMAVLARKEGILALEPKIEEIDDPFLKKGLQLVVDG